MESRDLYREAREQLVKLCRPLSDEQATAEVPACPGWTVKDVVAHVTGIASDVLNGELDGSGTDSWTAKQVDSRRDLTLTQVLSEYVGLDAALDDLAAHDPATVLRMGRDLTVHEHDIRAAVDRPGNRSTDYLAAVAHSYALGFIDRVSAAGLDDIAVEIEGSRFGASDAKVEVSGECFELLRCLAGRRSRGQAEALTWTGDHRAHVALIPTYGDFQIMDVIE